MKKLLDIKSKFQGDGSPTFSLQCDRDLLEESLDMAKELAIPIHIHVAETKEESGIILKRYGKRPLTFLEELGYLDHPSVFAHGVELNEREIETLGNFSSVYCPQSY